MKTPELRIVAALLAFLLLASASIAAAEGLVVEQQGPQVVGVLGTPYGQGVVFGAVVSVQDGVTHVLPRAEGVVDEDGDTKVFLDFQVELSNVGVWLLYDGAAQRYGVGGAVDRTFEVPFPNSGLGRSTTRGAVTEMTIPWVRVRVLVARGVEAWVTTLEDGGAGDLEPGAGVRFDIARLRPLSGGAAATSLQAGDFIALLDPDRYVIAATWLTQNDLQDDEIVR